MVDLEDAVEKAGKENIFTDKTELAQVMDNLDTDEVNADTFMSNIDFNTRLDHVEIQSIMIVDELIRLGIFPSEIGLTRQKKRLAVSLDGKGRSEKVEIVASERNRRGSGGFIDGVKNLFTRQ